MKEEIISTPLNAYIDEKLAEISYQLPELVFQNPGSFECGHRMGYKQALLDIERFLDGLALPKELWMDFHERTGIF
jgi:hypothetical protein